jgi:hypothetical protein
MKKTAVFCGSAAGSNPGFRQTCLELAGHLYDKRIGIVYGGGNIGLMGILADEMLRLGGEVIGVIPKKLVEIELAHNGLSRLHIVADMHERKALMARLSDAFIILPGGIGTMEEFFEMYTWLQLGYHHKPVALLNALGFYDLLTGLLEHMVQEGFFQRSVYEKLIVEKEPQALLNRMMATGML